MRVNVYAEEMTERVEIISKEIDGQVFTGLRFYLELPATLPPGVELNTGETGAIGIHKFSVNDEGRVNVRGPFMHRLGDDDSAAVTFWGKRDLRDVLREALAMLDDHYEGRARRAAEKPAR